MFFLDLVGSIKVKLLRCLPLNSQIIFLFFNSKECLLFGFYTKMDLYNQPTQPNLINLWIKQKFIHWATRGSLNNHCNNKDLLGIKPGRTVTDFLHTSMVCHILLSRNHVSFIWLYTPLNGENQPMLRTMGLSYGPFSKGM